MATARTIVIHYKCRPEVAWGVLEQYFEDNQKVWSIAENSPDLGWMRATAVVKGLAAKLGGTRNALEFRIKVTHAGNMLINEGLMEAELYSPQTMPFVDGLLEKGLREFERDVTKGLESAVADNQGAATEWRPSV